MDLETLTTPVRYIYVGLERSRGLFFPANLQRNVGPAKDAFGGTRWRTRKRKTGASRTKRTKRTRRKVQEEKRDRSGHTWQCTTKAWWMRGRLVYVIGTWSPANGVVRLSMSAQFSLSFARGWLVSASFALPAPRTQHTRVRTHPCHWSDRSCCHIRRTRPYSWEELLPYWVLHASQCLLCRVHTTYWRKTVVCMFAMLENEMVSYFLSINCFLISSVMLDF